MGFNSKIGDVVFYDGIDGKITGIDNDQHYGLEVTFQIKGLIYVAYFNSMGVMKDRDKRVQIPLRLKRNESTKWNVNR